jgi:hypothetical protein
LTPLPGSTAEITLGFTLPEVSPSTGAYSTPPVKAIPPAFIFSDFFRFRGGGLSEIVRRSNGIEPCTFTQESKVVILPGLAEALKGVGRFLCYVLRLQILGLLIELVLNLSLSVVGGNAHLFRLLYWG